MNKELFNLVGRLEIKSNGERIIAGYGNVAIVDSQNQFIPLETLKQGLNTLLSDSDYASLMLSHNNVKIGKILKSYGRLTTHVDERGLFLIAKLRDDIEIANEAWENILKGEINGFSIGLELLSEPREVCDANGCITYLDKINILECSICNHPINKMSGFVVISKSDLSGKDVCESCNIFKKGNMPEKKKEEQSIEQKEEPKELSVEERIEQMERSIFNIQSAITKITEAYTAKSEEENKSKVPEEKKIDEEKKPETIKNDEVPLTKKDIEEMFIKSINTIIESFKPKDQDKKEKSELELALKARDEQIISLKKHIDDLSAKEKIEVVKKAEENSEPKTVQDNTDKEKQIILEDDYPIVVSKGEVTLRRFV